MHLNAVYNDHLRLEIEERWDFFISPLIPRSSVFSFRDSRAIVFFMMNLLTNFTDATNRVTKRRRMHKHIRPRKAGFYSRDCMPMIR
jgi:hypothetical protein